MRVHVAFTPGEQTPAPIGIVVDVLRATSTMTQALAAGYRRVLCCSEIDEARALAETEGPAKLAGERDADAHRGLRLRQLAERGRRRACRADARPDDDERDAAARLRGRSGSSASTSARSSTSRRSPRRRPRAGRTSPSSAPASSASSPSTTRTAPGGSPRRSAATRTTPPAAAIRLARSFDGPLDGLGASQSARNLHRVGLENDIAWCAQESVIALAPRFAGMVGVAAQVTL